MDINRPTKENPMITKDQLVASYHGGPKGKAHKGTLVRVTSDVVKASGREWEWTLPAGVYEVTDLFARKNYNKPDEIAIVWRPGVATSVRLDQIELA